MRSLTVEIGADLSGLEAGLQRASGLLRGLGNMAASAGTAFAAGLDRAQAAVQANSAAIENFANKTRSVGAAMSIGITAPLSLLAKGAVTAFGEMDALRRGLATLEKDSGTLTARLKTLAEVAKLPGLGVKEAIQFDIALRSAGFSAELSQRSMLAFGNALASIGKGKNELKGLSVQLQQLSTKSGGFGADLRLIKEYAPQVGKALQNSFGTVDTEAIAKTGVTGKQVVERIVGELEKLPKATGGVKNAFENMGDALTSSLDKVGKTIDKAIGLSALSEKVGAFLNNMADRFAGLSPTIQKVIVGFGIAAAVIGPLLLGLGGLLAIVPAISAGIATLTAVLGVGLAPILGIAAAVAAAAGLIIYNWDAIKKALVDSGMWTTAVGLVRETVNLIKGLFSAMVNTVGAIWNRVGGLVMGALKVTFAAIAGAFNFFGGVLHGIMQVITGVLTMDWRTGLTGLLNILKSVGNLLIDGFKLIVLALGQSFAGLIQFFGGNDIADKMRAKVDSVLSKINGYRFNIQATVSATVARKVKPEDPFKDFNFGGAGVDNNFDAKSKAGKKAKTKKEKADETGTISFLDFNTNLFENLLKQKKELEQSGELVPERMLSGLFALAQRLGRIKDLFDNLDIIKGVKSMAVRGAGIAERFQSVLPQPTQLLNRGVKTATTGIDAGILVDVKAMDIAGKMAEFQRGTKELSVELKNREEALRTFNGNMSNILSEGAQAAFVGMGQVIGGLLTGSMGIEALPAMLLSTLGSVLTQLGQMAIAVGIGLKGISAALQTLNPVLAIAAGVGLLALGSIVSSGAKSLGKKGGYTAFAEGGGVTGSTFALLGEGRGTTRNNPELAIPANKLKSYIQGMVDTAGAQTVYVTGKLSGQDMYLQQERARRFNEQFSM